MPIAKEAALKFKECSYIHAEALSAGDLKHGPIALIDSTKEGDNRDKIILFIMDDDRLEEMSLALDEVKARNSYTIVITDCIQKLDKSKIDFNIVIPHINLISGILAIIPIQLTLIALSTALGINPDRPRNLAKCVTVL